MKIVVIGVSASGKTTFTKKLAEKLGLPAYFMDQIMWNPGWDYIGDEATVAEIEKIISTDQWIVEGYITTAARTNIFKTADTIIYLDYPGSLSAWRYIKRWWKHRRSPRPELPGSPESFSWKFLKLVYTKGEAWRVDDLFKENDWNNKIVRFKKPAEAQTYLMSI